MNHPYRPLCIILQDFALGGTERVALTLARAWSEMGRAVTIFCGQAEGPLRDLIAGTRVRVVVAPGEIPRQRGSIRRLGIAAARFLKTEPHHSCFIPGNYHWKAIPPIDHLPAGIRPRIVAQLSSPIRKPQRRGWRQLGFEWKMRRLLGEIDALVTLSDAHLTDSVRLLPGVPVRTIPLPAVRDDNVPAEAAAGQIIVAAGRLAPQKGFDDLIAAFARVENVEARLVIVGEGEERPYLEAMVERLGLGDRVSLPGFLPDIRPALETARLFILSSRYEGYGAVVVEALAAGRPVVSTDCTPATRELLIDDRFGVTVPIGDPAALARAITHLLALPAPDPAMLAHSVDRHRIAFAASSYLALIDDRDGGHRQAGQFPLQTDPAIRIHAAKAAAA